MLCLLPSLFPCHSCHLFHCRLSIMRAWRPITIRQPTWLTSMQKAGLRQLWKRRAARDSPGWTRASLTWVFSRQRIQMVRPLSQTLCLSRFKALWQSCNYCSTTTQSCQSAHPETVIFFPPPTMQQPSTFLVMLPLKCPFGFYAAQWNNICLCFAQLFTFCRYSWHWFRHNCKIYILLCVVFKTDAHMLEDTQARRRRLRYTHLKEMMLVWGRAGLL